MSATITLATAQRVLRQIRHDPRTVALLLVVPALLLVLLRYVFGGRPGVFQSLGAPLCGLFVSRDEMAGALHAASAFLPFTYAYDALARATEPGPLGAGLAVDVAVILLTTLGALALAAVTLRRRTD